MAAEVIDLLSSPEVRPQRQPRPAQKPPAPKPTSNLLALNSDDMEFPDIDDITASTVKATSGATISTHSSKKPRDVAKDDNKPRRKDGNDFLFLSDDFDTTGDLDFDLPNNSRVSPRPAVKASSSRSMARASSGVLATNPSGSGLKRWSSVADPIQHTSSPIGLDDDLFASSPPPGKSTKGKQPEKSGLSKNVDADSRTTTISATHVFDLTSDFSDCSPAQDRKGKGKQKVEWDPISSSMPEMSTVAKGKRAISSSPPKVAKRKADVIELDSSDSEDELPELGHIRANGPKLSRSLSSSPRITKRSKTTSAGSSTQKSAPKTQEEKDLEKKRKAQARELEKEMKQLEKEKAKKEKAAQKEKDKALAEVNKVRVNKADAQVEMIVDIPRSLDIGLNERIIALLNELRIEHAIWDSPIDKAIRWRRKVDRKFNKDKDYFEPVPLRIVQEKHALIVVDADEFVKLSTASEGSDLAAHVLKMKRTFPDSEIIYLLEGLDQWFRKNKTARNRQFQNAARNETNTAVASGRRRQAAHEIVDEEVIEDALLSLQVDHGVMIHKTNASVETAQWITVFTQHISTIPYRKRRDELSRDAGFSVESGQVKTGENAKETYILMLQEVARVTTPMAQCIADAYPTLTDLVRGFERDGPGLLEDLKRSTTGNGHVTEQRIGPSISRRLHKIFTGRDPTSTEV
ncbi:ERCC4 domain-containing protein [Pestalotiopsis sp. NC0098]|nr:ERCC4 domain-containing protein [Pestalotiopsis sp. NC0098]